MLNWVRVPSWWQQIPHDGRIFGVLKKRAKPLSTLEWRHGKSRHSPYKALPCAACLLFEWVSRRRALVLHTLCSIALPICPLRCLKLSVTHISWRNFSPCVAWGRNPARSMQQMAAACATAMHRMAMCPTDTSRRKARRTGSTTLWFQTASTTGMVSSNDTKTPIHPTNHNRTTTRRWPLTTIQWSTLYSFLARRSATSHFIWHSSLSYFGSWMRT